MRTKPKTSLRKYLSVGDSGCTVAWMHKSSFNPITMPGHDLVARTVAEDLMEKNSSLYPQHLGGKYNVVCDSLSRDHHIPTKKLTFLLKSLFPTQAGPNFKISPMHKDDISWLYSVKATLTAPMGLPKPRTRSKLGALINGDHSWPMLVSMMSSLLSTHKNNELPLSAHLHPLLEEMTMTSQENLSFDTARYLPPLATYVRPAGRIFGTTPL